MAHVVLIVYISDVHWFNSGCCQSVSDSAYLHCRADTDVQGP